MPADEPEAIARTAVDLVKTRLLQKFQVDPVRDVQVLCPMNRGLTGANGMNQLLQEALNPPGEGSIEKFSYNFGVAAKVMQIQNNYDKDVYNGDFGHVTHIDPDEQELTAIFDEHLEPTHLANWMNWCSVTRRRSTNSKGRNTQWS